MNWMVIYCVIFQFLAMLNTIVGAGAGAASRYGCGSDQKMRLLAAPAPAPQHCLLVVLIGFVVFVKASYAENFVAFVIQILRFYFLSMI
jgi:hypothetical protein